MKYIRDCIYNYIPISKVESIILEQPEILRLHRVLQNSTLYLTYPNNRSARFSHSVGAMHVAGLIYRSLVRNSNKEYIKNLHVIVRDYLSKLNSKYLEASKNYLIKEYQNHHGIKEFHSSFGWNMREESERDESISKGTPSFTDMEYYNTLNNILFEAIRLAALVHDIGHLPYSHAIEYAIKDSDLYERSTDIMFTANNAQLSVSLNMNKLRLQYLRIVKRRTGVGNETIGAEEVDEEAPPHEMIGLVLIDKIFQRIFPTLNTNLALFYRACWLTAIRILIVDQIPHFLSKEFARLSQIFNGNFNNIISWYPLGNIISSSIDCDRLDYLRRDPYTSGITELASFDSERIIDSAVLVKPRAKGYLGEAIAENFQVLGFGRRSLSSLADFHNDRMRQYRWLVNHHNVVRTDMSLARLVIILHKMLIDESNQRIIKKWLRDNGFFKLWKWDNIENDFRFIDDAWFDTLLHNLQRELLLNINNRSPEEEECLLYLNVIFDRKIDKLRQLWKTLDDFLPFSEQFYKTFRSEYEEHQLAVSEDLKQLIEKGCDNTDYIYFTNRVLTDWISITENRYGSYSVMFEIEKSVDRQLNKRIFFVYKRVKVYEGVPVALETGDGSGKDKVRYLDEMSSLAYNLNDIYYRDLMLYSFEVLGSNILKQEKRGKKYTWSKEELENLGRIISLEVFKNLQNLSSKRDQVKVTQITP